ncbi:Aste57867_21483 [Aphanomyces stellatus]|uniref:Aste57867_21483 protein n=1 Tax=Aphanomyces stellatus TaxID=120398 RepID=A0A485LHK6_9STRA|nr:hypothetical protein As57867_021414 [Aphanomyces stellatus]VFT98153.1 Aste57867_21483 [Aphanomyces stellatus]
MKGSKSCSRRRRADGPGADECKLPPDLIQRIAVLIPSPDDFFHYLDAFQGSNSIGNLQHLWHLAQASSASGRYPDDLWPELHIHVLDDDMVDAIQAVSMYFPVIHFHHVYDLSLLLRCVVSPSTSFEFHQCPQRPHDVSIPLHTWYAELAALPLSRLTWCDNEYDADQIQHLMNVLSTMPRLRALNLDFASVPSLASVLGYIRSSGLVDFSMKNIRLPAGGNDPDWMVDSPDPVMTNAWADHLIHWLMQQPVQSLQLTNWIFNLADVVATAFYDALWHGPSRLQKLSFREMQLPPLRPIAEPIQIVELELFDCALGTADFIELARGLRHSPVQSLNLGCNAVEAAGIVAIAESLPESTVRALNLIATNLDEEGCKALARAMPAAGLVELHLGMNGLTNGAVLHLADVLRTTPSLLKIGLQWNGLTMSGAVALVHMLGLRPHPFHALDLRNNRLDEGDEDLVKGMVANIPHVDLVVLTKRDSRMEFME